MRNPFLSASTIRRSSRLAAALVLGVASLATQARASHYIQDCTDYCDTQCPDPDPSNNCRSPENGACQLYTNINCANGENIRLKNGANLDMNGKTLHCTATTCTGAAVIMEANGSRVFNGSGEGIIDGNFQNGVSCNGYVGSEVDGITILDVFTGVSNCRKVHHNLIGRLSLNVYGLNNGVVTDVYAGTDFIRENYFQDRTLAITLGSGTYPINIEDNVFETTANGSPVSYGTAIVLTFNNTSSEAVVRGNVILGGGSTIYGSPWPLIVSASGPLTEAAFSTNVCGRAHPNCASCRSAGYCATPASPFAW